MDIYEERDAIEIRAEAAERLLEEARLFDAALTHERHHPGALVGDE